MAKFWNTDKPYTPTPGWFDLTERPQGVPAAQHKKIQDLQMVVITEAAKYKSQKMRDDNHHALSQLQDLAAELQQTILSRWPHEALFNK